MEELIKNAETLKAEVEAVVKKLKLNELVGELDELNSQMTKSDFWQDQARAQASSKRQADLARRVQPWQKLQAQLAEALELAKLKDESVKTDVERQIERAKVDFEKLKKDLRHTGPFDDHNVILSLHAGAGGTDAQDWAQMLLRMYTRWAEGQGAKVITLDQSAGEEAGIKSATLEISGLPFLYGQLAGEHGVHRLVRLSPYNADAKRQTSFAKVEVLPEIEKPSELELDDKDLKVDVFRSGGAGGQSVNTTDSAVRVTHLPTGLSVAIQNERSQLQNKATAMKILRSRLAALQLEQHQEKIGELKGPVQSAEWGNQIRSYVLHPYKQVKDLRSGYESSDPEKVLDGDLEPFIAAWLEK